MMRHTWNSHGGRDCLWRRWTRAYGSLRGKLGYPRCYERGADLAAISFRRRGRVCGADLALNSLEISASFGGGWHPTLKAQNCRTADLHSAPGTYTESFNFFG